MSELRSAELPFASGQRPLRIGTRRLAQADWLDPDDELVAQTTAKERLFAERPADVYRALPSSQPAAAETLDLVVAHLTERYPQLYRRAGDTLLRLADGREFAVSEAGLPELVHAGMLVQEDLCLLEPGPGGYVLSAAFVCAPSHWRLDEKIGRLLAALHGPVPGYAETLAAPVDRLFERLAGDALLGRSNWTIGTSHRLFEPERDRAELSRAASLRIEEVGDALYLRMESQTLRRLARTRAVLFTIRVHVDPLRVLASQPAAARDLAAAIRGLTEDERRYKSLDRLQRPLLGYLDTIAGTSPAAAT